MGKGEEIPDSPHGLGRQMSESSHTTKRLKTVAPRNRLLYSLNAMKFASPSDAEWHAVLQALVPFLMYAGEDGFGMQAPTLRALLLVNKDAKNVVVSELRSSPASDGGDVATAFCKLANFCQACGGDPEADTMYAAVGAHFWNPWTRVCVEHVILCSRCADTSIVSLAKSATIGYENETRVPYRLDTRARPSIDKRLLLPFMGVAGVKAFVDTFSQQHFVQLFLPKRDPAIRVVTQRLRACDVTAMLDPLQARIDAIDNEKRLERQAVLDDELQKMVEFLAEHGVIYTIDPPLMIDEVSAAPSWQDAKTEREDLAARMKDFIWEHAGTCRLGPATDDRTLIEEFCDTLRRRDVHPTFDWVEGPISIDADLILCDCILSGCGVRVRRVATTTWTARRGGSSTSVVDIAVELPFRRRPVFLVHTTVDVADALGPCCANDSTDMRRVDVEFLPALERLMTTCRSRTFRKNVAWHLFKTADQDAEKPRQADRLCLPSGCAHLAPLKKRPGMEWHLQSCRRCVHVA